MNIRYEAYKKSGSTENYSIWLQAKIRKWGQESYRAKEMALEAKDGWHFPVLCSTKDNENFDKWLIAKDLTGQPAQVPAMQ